MPDVSAAIIVLAGALVSIAGALTSTLTDLSRQRFIALGLFITLAGGVFWTVAFTLIMMRMLKG